MISNTYSKDEELEPVSTLVSSFFINLSLKRSWLNYHALEQVRINKLLSIICILSTYTEFLGIICSGIHFKGISESFFNSIMHIFNRINLLQQHPSIFSFILIVLFCVNVLYLINLVTIIFTIQQTNSTYVHSFIRLYQYMNIFNFWWLINWQIEMSLFTLLDVISLNQIFKALSVVNIVCSITIGFIYCYSCNKTEFNFVLYDYFSRLDALVEFYLLMVKVVLAVNYAIFESVEKYYGNIYLAICFIIIAFLNCIMWKFSFYYVMMVNTLFMFFNFSTLYVAWISFFLYNFNPNGGDFLVAIGYLTWFPVCDFIVKYNWNSLLSKIPFVEIKDESSLCAYMIALIYLICEEKITEKQSLKLIGVIKQHQQNCVYEDCVCKEEETKRFYWPLYETEYIYQANSGNNQTTKKFFKYLIIKQFEFLNKVIRGNNNNLIMLYSYYMYFYIGNWNIAMHAWYNLKKRKGWNTQQKTSLNRISEMIRHKIVEKNQNLICRIPEDGCKEYYKLDYFKLINYYEMLTKLKISINLSIEYSTQFWSNIQNKQSIHLIKKYGLLFYKYHHIIEQIYKTINKIYDGYSEADNIYDTYKHAVFNEIQKEKGLNVNNNVISHIEISKFINKNCVFVIANFTEKHKAIIEKITENVQTWLGYSSSECLGQDVKLWMPNIYKIYHSTFINNFFQSGKQILLNHEKTTFALHAHGYCLPVFISAKMLPDYNDKSYYVGVIRERGVDYDFIITNVKGKIEIISKYIISRIFTHTSISWYNSIDYYIHYICKEYFIDIDKIYTPGYKCGNHISSEQKEGKYNNWKYTLLHFKNSPIIDNILIEHRKKENSNQSMYDYENEGISSSLQKIMQCEDKIKTGFETDCLIEYAKIEEYKGYYNERFMVVKWYRNLMDKNVNSINVNIDEIRVINQYISQHYRKVKKEMCLRTPYDKFVQGLKVSPVFKKCILEKHLSNARNTCGDNTSFGSVSSDIIVNMKTKVGKSIRGMKAKSIEKEEEEEKYIWYLSIKQNYSSSEEYNEIRFILWVNFICIASMTLFMVLIFWMEREILRIYQSISTEYYSILPITQHWTIIFNNFLTIISKDIFYNDTEKDLPFIMSIYETSQAIIRNYTEEINQFNKITYDFSQSFLPKLNEPWDFTNPHYANISIKWHHWWVTFSSLLNSINSIDQVGFGNINIIVFILNIREDFLEKMWELFIYSLVDTREVIISKLNWKNCFNFTSISCAIIFGCYIYSKILRYFCVQTKMISMLCSIKNKECEKIIQLIREYKISIQKKWNESDITNTSRSEEGKLMHTKEKEVIDNAVVSNDEENHFLNHDTAIKVSHAQATGKNNPIMKVQYKSSLSFKIVVVYLIITLVIVGIDIAPLIYSIASTFYADKCKTIIYWIINFNINHFSFLNANLVFHLSLLTRTNLNENLVRIETAIEDYKTNQINTTEILLKTVKGLANQSEFVDMFTKNFCWNKQIPGKYCYENSQYYKKSFMYIINYNYEWIENWWTNTNIIDENKTIDDFYFVLHHPRNLMIQESFNVLTLYGFNTVNGYIAKWISDFIENYYEKQILIFTFNILCMLIAHGIAVILMKHIIVSVDVELKHIFSWMPFPLAINDKNIREVWAK